MADTKPLRMISLKVSDICELGRWLLEWAAIPFYEEFHVPVLSLPATLLAGGGLQAPVVVRPGQTPWPAKMGVIQGVDSSAPPGRRVFGEAADERAKNQAFLQQIIPPLNPIGTLCYHYILPHKELLYPVASAGPPPAWELWVLRSMYPLWRALMGLALDGDAAKVEQSRVSVDAGLDLIDQELAARGTPFLAGAEPAGMDVVVSALLSPVVWPPQYGGALPPLEKTPQPLQDFVMKTRARPSGRLALATYAKIRQQGASDDLSAGGAKAAAG